MEEWLYYNFAAVSSDFDAGWFVTATVVNDKSCNIFDKRLRCGGKYYNTFVVNFLTIMVVKGIENQLTIFQSFQRMYSGIFDSV